MEIFLILFYLIVFEIIFHIIFNLLNLNRRLVFFLFLSKRPKIQKKWIQFGHSVYTRVLGLTQCIGLDWIHRVIRAWSPCRFTHFPSNVRSRHFLFFFLFCTVAVLAIFATLPSNWPIARRLHPRRRQQRHNSHWVIRECAATIFKGFYIYRT